MQRDRHHPRRHKAADPPQAHRARALRHGDPAEQGTAKITFKKKDRGGIAFTPNNNGDTTYLDTETVTNICKEYNITHADVKLHEDATDEDLIDVIEGLTGIERVYVPAVYAINKVDQITVEELELLSKMKHYVPISANKEWNLDGLLETVWEYLDMVRIYTKPARNHPGLRGSGGAAAKVVHGGGFLQQAAQGDHQEFQDGARVGFECEASPAEGWKGARLGGRGRRADCQKGVSAKSLGATLLAERTREGGRE